MARRRRQHQCSADTRGLDRLSKQAGTRKFHIEVSHSILTSPTSHASPHRRFSVAPGVSGSSGMPPAKRSPVVAAIIETPKIHKPIDAGERHFRSAQSKKLQVSIGNI